MRSRTFRRGFFLLLLATGPLATACEAVLDFDRTPLQPVYEAGAADSTTGDGSSGTRPDGAVKDTGGGSDAPDESGPKDAGSDAEGGDL